MELPVHGPVLDLIRIETRFRTEVAAEPARLGEGER